jgi:hypothetical protein
MALTVTVVALGGTTIKSGPGNGSQGIGDSPWTLNWHVVLPGSVRWSSDRHISVRPENTHEMLNVLKQSTKVLLTLL